MRTLSYWMPSLRKFHKDYTWIAKYIEDLYEAIRTNRPHEYRLALEALNLLCPYILIYGDGERWMRLWFDSLRNAQGVRDEPAQNVLWHDMGRLYALSGNHKRGRAALMNSLDRAKEREDLELVLTSYIGLISLQTISQDKSFSVELINTALDLARELNEPRLWAELHKGLALAYNARHETVQSLAHGQTAYCYWRMIGNKVEMARTTFTLSQTCRMAKRYTLAKHFLDLSRSLYAQTPSGARHAALDYEEGQLHLEQASYGEAAQWFEYASREFHTLNQSYYRGAAVHALAVTYTYLERFDEAEEQFEEALKIWLELENLYEQANLYHGWSELKRRRGDTLKCAEFVYEGLRLCKELPDTPACHKIEAGLNEILDEVSKPLYL